MAVILGVVSLGITKLLKRIPARRITIMAGGMLVPISASRLAVALWFDGTPPFILWLILFSLSNLCIVAMFPTLNSLALEPMGALAGTAASVIGFTTMVGGAGLAAVTDRSLGDSVLPLAVAYLCYGSVSFVLQVVALRQPSTAVEQAVPAGV
jgi:DHA1 family bicyclomycin/chloramphenicol resistance-like MFS transporter